MTEQLRHIAVICVGGVVIAMGGAVAVVAAWLKLCEHELFLVALGIVGAGSAIISGEFGLARSVAPAANSQTRIDHPLTINQESSGKP